MNRWQRLVARMRRSKANVDLSDLEGLLKKAGLAFDRQEGSHRIFKHPSRPNLVVNLQRAQDGKAKPYQVRQVLKILEDLGATLDDKQHEGSQG